VPKGALPSLGERRGSAKGDLPALGDRGGSAAGASGAQPPALSRGADGTGSAAGRAALQKGEVPALGGRGTAKGELPALGGRGGGSAAGARDTQPPALSRGA